MVKGTPVVEKSQGALALYRAKCLRGQEHGDMGLKDLTLPYRKLREETTERGLKKQEYFVF